MIEPHFRKTCDFRMRILRDEFLHSLVTQVFTDYNNLPIFIQRVCSYRFARINIPQVPEGVSPDIICQCYLYDRSVQFSQLGTQSLVNFITEWSRFDGRLSRILEIVVAFDAAGAIGVLGPEVLAGCAGSADQARIEVGGLDLVAPRGQRLAERVSFDLAPGAPVLVTGPNASGKSLLGGVLTGLWPPTGAGARVSVPGVCELTGLRPPLDLLMAVPQRVYLPSGTLGDQVCYPGDYCPTPGGEGAQEAKMRRALQAAGIEYLLAREPKGWAAEHAWELLLSGGEQQRLSLARAFYRAPRFALLDECTSMIANDAEEGLYRTLVEEFGVTALTLTQRLFMRDLYRWELHLGTGTEKGWSLADLGA